MQSRDSLVPKIAVCLQACRTALPIVFVITWMVPVFVTLSTKPQTFSLVIKLRDLRQFHHTMACQLYQRYPGRQTKGRLVNLSDALSHSVGSRKIQSDGIRLKSDYFWPISVIFMVIFFFVRISEQKITDQNNAVNHEATQLGQEFLITTAPVFFRPVKIKPEICKINRWEGPEQKENTVQIQP